MRRVAPGYGRRSFTSQRGITSSRVVGDWPQNTHVLNTTVRANPVLILTEIPKDVSKAGGLTIG
jgi:hypothetical protein